MSPALDQYIKSSRGKWDLKNSSGGTLWHYDHFMTEIVTQTNMLSSKTSLDKQQFYPVFNRSNWTVGLLRPIDSESRPSQEFPGSSQIRQHFYEILTWRHFHVEPCMSLRLECTCRRVRSVRTSKNDHKKFFGEAKPFRRCFKGINILLIFTMPKALTGKPLGAELMWQFHVLAQGHEIVPDSPLGDGPRHVSLQLQ